MKGKNENNFKGTVIDDLKDIVKDYPIHYIIGTASLSYPSLTCEKAIEILNNGEDEKYDLIPIYDQRQRQLLSKEDFFNYNESDKYDALCPFHNDLNLGAFKITPSMNLYYCFACGAKGDAIGFEQNFFGLGFRQAVLHLAYRLGIISTDQISGEDFNIDVKRKIKETSNNITKRNKQLKNNNKNIADPVLVHSTYHYLRKVCGLSERDRNHLIEERKIPVKSLEDYFTFPKKSNEDFVINKILSNELKDWIARELNKSVDKLTSKDIYNCNPKEKMNVLQANLIYTPGFYFDNNERKIKINNKSGIGLLCKTHHGLITGVQVRNRYVKKGGTRYVWFSSGFASSEADLKGGATSGSPGGFVEAYNGYCSRQKTLCITEGRFKAEALAKDNYPTLYVSGVSTWKSIKEMYSYLKSGIDKVNIVFDSDMMGNTGVHNHLTALAKDIKKTTKKPVYLTIWSKQRGKGYDDLLNNYPNDYKKYIKNIPFESFEKTYNKLYNFLLKKYNVNKERDIKDTKEAKRFEKQMQYTLEKIYKL